MGSRLCETVGSGTENRFITEEQKHEETEKDYSRLPTVAAAAAAVYLLIIRLRNGAIICSRKSDN